MLKADSNEFTSTRSNQNLIRQRGGYDNCVRDGHCDLIPRVRRSEPKDSLRVQKTAKALAWDEILLRAKPGERYSSPVEAPNIDGQQQTATSGRPLCVIASEYEHFCNQQHSIYAFVAIHNS